MFEKDLQWLLVEICGRFCLVGEYQVFFDLKTDQSGIIVCMHMKSAVRCSVYWGRVFSSGTEVKAPPHKCPKA